LNRVNFLASFKGYSVSQSYEVDFGSASAHAARTHSSKYLCLISLGTAILIWGIIEVGTLNTDGGLTTEVGTLNF